MTDIPEKLSVKGPNDLFIPTKPEILHAKPVEGISDAPVSDSLKPEITWGELIKASINSYLRDYVVDTVTGKVITGKTRFWFGFASGVVISVIVLFLYYYLRHVIG